MTRYFTGDEIADIRNAWGCNVPWDRLAGHFDVTVAELQAAVGAPQWNREPVKASADTPHDLWSAHQEQL